MKETYSNFTFSILFILYQLFDSVMIGKPYPSSPLSSTQYLVCKGKGTVPEELFTYLETLYTCL